MVYGKTNTSTCKDEKQLDVQNLTMYRPQKNSKDTVRTNNVQVDPLKCWFIKAVIDDVITT